MFGLFRKKKASIQEHLKELVNKPNTDFQLDVIRNKDVDFQIIRQRMIKGFDTTITVNNPEGFSIMISFNPNTDIGLLRYSKFKASKIYDLFKEIKNMDETFLFFYLKCENNLKTILNFIHKIQTEVYGYTDDTYYYFKFKEI